MSNVFWFMDTNGKSSARAVFGDSVRNDEGGPWTQTAKSSARAVFW